MKKFILLLLSVFLINAVNAQCPDSVKVSNDTLYMYYRNSNKPNNTVTRIEMDTLNGSNYDTISLVGTSYNGNPWIFKTYIGGIGLNEHSVYQRLRYFNGASSVGTECSDPGALPVELLYFKSKRIENKVIIEWATALEYNADIFILEKATIVSSVFDNYKPVYTVSCTNTNAISTYSYVLTDDIEDVVFIRLLQRDNDGTTVICGNIILKPSNYERPIIMYETDILGRINNENSSKLFIKVYTDKAVKSYIIKY
jgi:hypothetical protein